MNKQTIIYIKLGDLTPHPRNARTHSKEQVAQVAKSIKRFGFTAPVLVDASQMIVAGHARVEAAKLAGLDVIPTVKIEGLTEAEIRAYMIADNKLAANADWDLELLGAEFEYFADPEFDIDPTITGFSMGEIDVILDDGNDEGPDPLDAFEGKLAEVPVTHLGDIWICGQHKLICGDATKPMAYSRLMGEERARAVFTDPPYNVPIDGHVCGSGKIKHAEFAMASGEMSTEEFIEFLEKSFGHMAQYSLAGALHFVCMDWRHMTEILAASGQAYAGLKNLCVWVKTNGGMGSLYRSQHELVFVFLGKAGKHINNVELGKHGRYRTNVWEYPGISSFGSKRDQELAMHPTVKPVAMVADAIKDVTNRGDIVLDAFAGSGTTLVAAEKTGRVGRAIELEPKYCDVIVKRLQEVVGEEAVLDGTGLTFKEIAARRAAAADDGEA